MRRTTLSLVSSAGEPASTGVRPATSGPDALYRPLNSLLASGGDDRLTLDPYNGFNMYGCTSGPRDDTIALSSSTASTLSHRAFEHLEKSRERLIERAAIVGFDEAFDLNIEHSRESLRMYLGLEAQKADVVFSPSGTDSQLHALVFASAVLGGPLTTIVVGADQTGSGTAYVARGRHFNRKTAAGRATLKGAPIGGEPDDFSCIDIPIASPTGTFRSQAEVDQLVLQAVEAAVRRGGRILLQAMHASKFGLRAPSDACLTELSSRWPDNVLVVVDACQGRIGRAMADQYLGQGYALLVTGSKFFMGPPFSGALLLPKRWSQILLSKKLTLSMLGPYADRTCFPMAWTDFRENFAMAPNLGQWLRWQAAFEEMRLYHMLAPSFRASVMSRLQMLVPAQIAGSRHLEPLELPHDLNCRGPEDEEFVSASIFPFLIRSGQSYAPLSWAKTLCEKLNHGGSTSMLSSARDLMVRSCHIGQPVALSLPGEVATAAPRICIGARNLFSSWSAGADPVERAVQRIAHDVDVAVRQLDLLVERLS